MSYKTVFTNGRYLRVSLALKGKTVNATSVVEGVFVVGLYEVLNHKDCVTCCTVDGIQRIPSLEKHRGRPSWYGRGQQKNVF